MQTFYAVRNKKGKFFRSRGIGYGDRWVDNLSDAKVYGKIGPAKGAVTYWAKSFPEYGVPDIVEITVTEDNIKI